MDAPKDFREWTRQEKESVIVSGIQACGSDVASRPFSILLTHILRSLVSPFADVIFLSHRARSEKKNAKCTWSLEYVCVQLLITSPPIFSSCWMMFSDSYTPTTPDT